MRGLPPNLTDRLDELIFSERAVAYLQVDADLNLASAGGNLRNYGLSDLSLNEPVVEQAFFLEGLLPPVESPYAVPSVELPGGRVADLHFHLDAGSVWVLLIDVTSERDAVRRAQQKAYEMSLLQEKEALLNQRLEAANAALRLTQRELEASRDLTRRELVRKQIELAEARTLQLALAPPSFEGMVGACALTADVMLEPAKEVGGDLVDHFLIGSDLLVLLVGDVSDKGAGAALMMARTHALFRGLMAHPDASRLFRAPEQAVTLVNTTLAAGNSACMFVTLLIAAFDGATNRLTYVRAGHVPPFLGRANGTIERLAAAGGPPLGINGKAVYRAVSAGLWAGDRLLIITDGITEAVDLAGCMFGDARVAGFMENCAVPLADLLSEVQRFEAGNPQSDDIAAILLKLDYISDRTSSVGPPTHPRPGLSRGSSAGQ
jgi:serine phosphatase RsbU (regulator of sigma subunit)